MSNNVLPTVFFSQEVLERLGRDDSELKEHLHIFFKQIVIGPFKEKETGPVQCTIYLQLQKNYKNDYLKLF